MDAVRTMVALLALILVTASAEGAGPLSPLVVDWARYFSVDSRPVTRDGRSVAGGTVWNISDWGASRIQLLVEALDASGRAVDRRVIWLGSDLAAGSNAYFEAPMPSSASYRVSVFAFNLDAAAGPR